MNLRNAEGQREKGVHVQSYVAGGALRGLDAANITFDQVRVPREHLLNRFANVSLTGTNPLHFVYFTDQVYVVCYVNVFKCVLYF